MPSESSDERTTPFLVLVVSTGDVARSVAASSLLVRAVADDQLSVWRAGTSTNGGEPVAAVMAAELKAWDRTTDGHASRRLTAEMVTGADLILALGRAERSAAVSLAPSALRRSFTLRELARLATAFEPGVLALQAGGSGVKDRWLALIELAPLVRDQAPVLGRDADVLDPRGRSRWAYRRALAEIDDAIAIVVNATLAVAAGQHTAP